jgi:hypothetical protein
MDNLPLRPILDAPLALLFYPGLLALALEWKRPWPGLWVFGLTVVSIAPSLLTIESPSFIRAVGVTVGTALIAGAGARFIANRLTFLRGLAPTLPVVLMLWSGVNSYRDTIQWLQNGDMYVLSEEHINTATHYMADHLPADRPVFFSPFAADHPNVAFEAGWLAPRPVGGFISESCIVIPEKTTTYFSMPEYDVDFQRQLSEWSDIQPVTRDIHAPLPWVIFNATPKIGSQVVRQRQTQFVFADEITVRAMEPLPDRLSPGSSVQLWIGSTALRPVTVAYQAFVHLYGHPTPYEGGPLWAQTDQPFCPSYPPDRWRPGELVIAKFELAMPQEIPAGRYTLAFGLYNDLTQARLGVTQPAGGGSYVALKEVSIP